MRNLSEVQFTKESPVQGEETGEGNLGPENLSNEKVATMSQADFLDSVKFIAQGYSDEQGRAFSAEDFNRFEPGRKLRMEKAKELLIALVPALRSEIEGITGLHSRSLELLRQIHHDFIENYLAAGKPVGATILQDYPDLKKKQEEAVLIIEKQRLINNDIIGKVSESFNDLCSKYMFEPNTLKQKLEEILRGNDVEVIINKKHCIITETKSGLQYIAAFPNNRPADAEVVNYFELLTENGERGFSNAPVRDFLKPAVVDSSSSVIIERGQLEVVKI